MSDKPNPKPYKFNFGQGVCDEHFVQNCPVCSGTPQVDKTRFETHPDVGGRTTPLSPVEAPVTTYGDCPGADPTATDPVVLAAKAYAEAKLQVVKCDEIIKELGIALKAEHIKRESALAVEAEAKSAMNRALNPPEPNTVWETTEAILSDSLRAGWENEGGKL